MICILDSSILLELLQVPGKSQDAQGIQAEFRRRAEDGAQFIVPLAAIIETGNHIGQADRDRYRVAGRFRRLVMSSLDGSAPFVVHPFPDPEAWRAMMERFAEWASRGSGLGDLTILRTFEYHRQRFPQRSVEIWSKDEHLSAYST